MSINQSVNQRAYPGSPTIVNDKNDQKVRSWVVFWMYWCTSVMSWRSDGRVFQAAGPEQKKPRSPNLVLVLGRT